MKRKCQLLFSMLVLCGSFLFISESALALCVSPSEPGSWVNVDSDTRSITKANVRFQCQDQILNGQPYPPGYPYYIHLYGKCHPTDCDWGEVGATRHSNGWLFTTIDHGFAKRYIWTKAYPGASFFQDRLRVYIWTDFDDPNRRDYASDDWFRRQLIFFPISLSL